MSSNLVSKTPRVSLTRFWGGKNRGVCVQLTSRENNPRPVLNFQYMTLTREEARTLAKDLAAFAEGDEVETYEHHEGLRAPGN